MASTKSLTENNLLSYSVEILLTRNPDGYKNDENLINPRSTINRVKAAHVLEYTCLNTRSKLVIVVKKDPKEIGYLKDKREG